MKAQDTNKTLTLSEADLAQLGGGALAYIREIGGEEAMKLLGSEIVIAPRSRLFCLYHADGTPVSISDSREAALGSASEHELMAMSVH
ncbi:MAG: DUF1150 family protein [Alphaproteobacteria bacterium]|nr:DUF1150 family protein [Alphaproteobacteria bacterium]